MTSSMSFLDAVKNRRTIYTLNKELPIGDDRIEELVKLSVHDILFFEDPNPTKELQCKFPTYAHHFPTWSEHTSAMHQYMLWTALEAEGCGCNLQHYHPIVDQKVKGHWNINMEWNLRVQLVFGGVPEGARDKLPEKTNLPLEERMIIHGK
ncbi:hypothetical protein LTR28_000014 [Elasticomyces elasticus]|nr:hypothetical protein LTR28_000014 [Elasticomyces elasticus]